MTKVHALKFLNSICDKPETKKLSKHIDLFGQRSQPGGCFSSSPLAALGSQKDQVASHLNGWGQGLLESHGKL